MYQPTRRDFLGLTAGGVLTALYPKISAPAESGPRGKRIPVIHASDLYRPHVDPDDHWDLACVFALAHRGDIQLKGVLIDFPPQRARDRNPDVLAVAQMNHITGLHVPVCTGIPGGQASRGDLQSGDTPDGQGGIRMVLDVLRESSEPVVINVVGCARDIAMAGKREPGLFSEKCAGIYLNAGTGSPDRELARKLEYNVSLDPKTYASIFDLPCPVYWMPCFEEMGGPRSVREFGTHYQFRQDEILPHLSRRMQNFFAYMLDRKTDSRWLTYLDGPVEREVLEKHGRMLRSMWCTGGFFHAAGYTVSGEGKIIPRDRAGDDDRVFTFDPIKIECSDQGYTRWSPHRDSRNRFIFHVRDTVRYAAALTSAMKTILTAVP